MQSVYGGHPPLADMVGQPQRIHSGGTGEMQGPVGFNRQALANRLPTGGMRSRSPGLLGAQGERQL